MGDLKTANTSYPAILDTATAISDHIDEVTAANINGPNSAIVAIEAELGVNPSGAVIDLATRLGINIHADGGLLRGTSFPASPTNVPHMFYRTDEKYLYVYNTSTASYDVVASLAVLVNYVRTDTANTIVAQHTFAPAVAVPPFILGANAQSQKVVGLEADKLDGQHRALTIDSDHTHASTGAQGGTVSHTALTDKGTNAHSAIDSFISSKAQASGLASLDASSKVVQDPASAGSGNGLDADKVDSIHAVTFLSKPAFSASLTSGNQGVSSGVLTKAQVGTEALDTDNCFDNITNYRFTPTIAGKYFITGAIEGFTDTTITAVVASIYKNGSAIKTITCSTSLGASTSLTPEVSCIVDMNGSTDYIELYGLVSGTGTLSFKSGSTNSTSLMGFKLAI